MVYAIFQVGLILLVAALIIWKVRRDVTLKNQSIEEMFVHLRNDWSGQNLSDHFLWDEKLPATTYDDAWRRMDGLKGLWVMHQNAGVMLQIANKIHSEIEGVDLSLIGTIRSDAMQIRVCVLAAIAEYAFTECGISVRINSFRAASSYTAMSARVMSLLQNYAALFVPSFVAAM
jgi:hypothetical protein